MPIDLREVSDVLEEFPLESADGLLLLSGDGTDPQRLDARLRGSGVSVAARRDDQGAENHGKRGKSVHGGSLVTQRCSLRILSQPHSCGPRRHDYNSQRDAEHS